MKQMKKTTLKEVFQNSNWIITKLYSVGSKSVRVDAKRRYPIEDESSFFSEWGSRDYLNKLSRDNYGKPFTELNCNKHY